MNVEGTIHGCFFVCAFSYIENSSDHIVRPYTAFACADLWEDERIY